MYDAPVNDVFVQNGLTFVAHSKSCATTSGWTPNQATSIRVTYNGVTKTWGSVFLDFYHAHFSPDSKHFAYTASNVQSNGRGDFYFNLKREGGKLQRFIVADNVPGPVYDNIYFPQYSADGNHLDYCAEKDGKYMKVIDGKETIVAHDDYHKICHSLFGIHQGQGNQSAEVISSNRTRVVSKSPCSGMGEYAVYEVIADKTSGKTRRYGPYDNVGSAAFSPDDKHFAFIAATYPKNCVVLDGERLESYDEVFNLMFSKDSNYVSYNVRTHNTVYSVVQPLTYRRPPPDK